MRASRKHILPLIFLFAMNGCRSAPAIDDSAISGMGWQNNGSYQIKSDGAARLGRDRIKSETAACADARSRENRRFSEAVVGVDLTMSCPVDTAEFPYCDWEYRLKPGIFDFRSREVSRKTETAQGKMYCEVTVEFTDVNLREKVRIYVNRIKPH